MWDKLKSWVRQWLGAGAAEGDEASPEMHARQYEAADRENITAVIAGKLALLTLVDSTIEVDGPPCVASRLRALFEQEAPAITAQTFGKGGKVLVPYVREGEMHLAAPDQSRMLIRDMADGRVKACTLIVDARASGADAQVLLADYASEGGVQKIRYRCVVRGALCPVRASEFWRGMPDEISLGPGAHLPLAYLRSPRDSRTDDRRYGVPITYGAEALMDELTEHARVYRREYRLTRPMLGLDSSLWREPGAKPVGIAQLRRTVQDGDDPFIPVDRMMLSEGGIWQYYAPAIRADAMEVRWQSLVRRIEKACGLSQGILTERQALNYANRDEVRAAMYDTFSVVRAMRGEWMRALEDLSEGMLLLGRAYGLVNEKDAVHFDVDWDQSLIEVSGETFRQYETLYRCGALSAAELRAWVRGGTLEENERAVARLRREADRPTGAQARPDGENVS